jgi:uncharacterized membrane protein
MKMDSMRDLALFFHLAGAIIWMGGMAFMVLALRPSLASVEPPARMNLVSAVLRRFFTAVAISIVVLAATGAWMFANAQATPRGWHVMAAIGLVMMLLFGHIFFAPYRRLQRAIERADWPAAAAAASEVTMLAKINLGLGWIAIAAVVLWH